MSGTALARAHAHMIIVGDGMDRARWLLVGLLTVLAVLVAVADLTRRRRARSDPALKAVADRVEQHDQFLRAKTLTLRVEAGEARLDEAVCHLEEVEETVARLRQAIVDGFTEAGEPVPPQLLARPGLRVINGGGGVA